MSLDLGAVVGRVLLDTSAFDRGYTLTVRRMAQLGTDAERSSKGVTTLDRSLVGAAESADKATTSTTRLSQSTKAAAASDERAAAASRLRSDAARRVSVALATVADASAKVQQAALREFAASQRLEAAYLGASTEAGKLAAATARLASSEASAIAAADRQAAATERETAAQKALVDSARAAALAQREATVSTRDLSTAQSEAAVSASRFKSGLKMAGELGLLIGGLEAIKQAIDIGKQATDFQQKMLLIKTSAGASTDEVKRMSDAVLNMAGDVATGPADLADALYHVEQNGLRGQKALNALRIGAEGAKVGMADVEDTTNTMTIAIASGIHGVNNMQRAMGFMIATVGTGDMRLRDLNEALGGGILSVAKGFGATLQDVAAILATLGDNGIRGANAAQALRQTMMGFAAPVKAGAAALSSVGLGMTDLRDAMEKHGLVYAMNDLEQHMTKAGVTGNKVGAFITEAFGKRAGAGVAVLMGEIDRLNTKYAEAQKGADTFASRWHATTQTVGFEWSRLGAEAEAAGIKMADAALPLAGALGSGLATGLSGVLHVLEVLAPELKVVGAVWLGMWVGRAAVAGMQAAVDGISSLRAAASNALVDIQRFGVGFGGATRAASEMTQTSAIMQAEFAKIAAAAQASAATQAEAQLAAMRTYQQVSEAEIAAMEETAAAARAAAVEAAAAADTASGAIVASGEAAEVGWAGLAGPLGAAALGIFAIVSMFHKSDTASKEATAAAKAYTDALNSGGGNGGDSILGTIVSQLSDNKVPELLASLNKELGRTAFTGSQFATAIEKGGAPLATLRDRLQQVIKDGTSFQQVGTLHAGYMKKVLTPAAQDAATALGHLNTQYSSLTAAAKKELLDAHSFHVAASSIDQVAQSTKLGTDQAKQYAAMLGFVADKNGVVAGSHAEVKAAVNSVATAYDTATQSGADFLNAFSTYASKWSGDAKQMATAADTAAIIGATLKAANGDALGFVTQMNAAAGAEKTFASDVRSAAKQAKESNTDYLKSIVDLQTGQIKWRSAAATPFINDLNQMQSSAMQAAQAMYQHKVATDGSKQAATEAYQVYRAQTSGALIDEATKLGLTAGQAKKLADQYFGMPKNVKTLIQAEGTNPIVSVLDRIGKQLSFLTHHDWNINVNRTVIDHTPVSGTGGLTAIPQAVGTRAAFGRKTIPPNTAFTVGEKGWEGGVTDSQGRASIFSNAQSRAMGFRAPVGYANGTNPSLLAYATGAGFKGQAAAIMAAIAQAESGGNARAHNYNPSTGDDSYGETQINLYGSLISRLRQFGLSSPAALYDPHTNFRVAYALSHGGRDFSPWTTYTSGKYLAFMGDAGSVTGAGGSGGSVTKVPGGYQYGDTVYASRRAAENAQRRATSSSASDQRQAGRQAVHAANQLGRGLGNDIRINKHGHAVGSYLSTSDVHSQLKSLMGDLHQAGVGKDVLDKLGTENKAILAAVHARDVAARGLLAANKKLLAAESRKHQDFLAFRSAARSTFDITSAGSDPVTGRVTKGGILAQQRQAITRLHKWFGGLHKVASWVPASYFRQLEGKGPDALPELEALLSMNVGQRSTFRQQAAQIASLSSKGAAFGSSHLDQHAINVARHNEHMAESRERQREKHLEKLFTRMEKHISGLTIGGTCVIDFKKGTLHFAVKADEQHSRHMTGSS